MKTSAIITMAVAWTGIITAAACFLVKVIKKDREAKRSPKSSEVDTGDD